MLFSQIVEALKDEYFRSQAEYVTECYLEPDIQQEAIEVGEALLENLKPYLTGTYDPPQHPNKQKALWKVIGFFREALAELGGRGFY